MNGYNPDHPLWGDPRPFDPDSDNDQERNAGALLMMAKAADNLLKDPPSEMKGEYLNDQSLAWFGPEPPKEPSTEPREAGIRQMIDGLVHNLRNASNAVLERAGLVGRAGKVKCLQVRDAIDDFLKLRTTRHAARFVNVCVHLLASLLGAMGGGEAVKEAFEGFKYLADLAIVGA